MRQNFRVEALALHQVGVFDDIRLDFKPIASPDRDADKAEIHLFTGPNGCGKSTLLYAIAEILGAVQISHNSLIYRRFRGGESCVDFIFSGKAGHYGTRVPDNSNAGSGFIGLFGQYWQLSYDENRGRFFGYDSLHLHSKLAKYKYNTLSFQSSNTHSLTTFPFAVFAYSGQRTLTDVKLGAIQQINNSPFENALSFDNTARPQVLLQWIANNRTQAALARQDGDKEAAAIYDRALFRITGLIHDICGMDVEFRLQRYPLAVTISLNGVSVHFDALPDGLKSIISWVADLSLRLEAIPWENKQEDVFSQSLILLLDEIDIHLHPKWQRRILPAVQKLLPNSQIFVSTHSPFVVGSVEDAWVYPLPEPGKPDSPLLVEGIPSAAGKSYRLILEEVFGVEGEFDVETEELFADFYEARMQFIKSPHDASRLLELAARLTERGEESAQIVARELRQLSRLAGREISLA